MDLPTAYSRNVYIASLPEDYTDAALRELFAPFGNIITCAVKRDRQTNLCKGYGFVLFERADDAVNAVLALQSRTVIGRNKVQVRLARPEASAKKLYPVLHHQKQQQQQQPYGAYGFADPATAAAAAAAYYHMCLAAAQQQAGVAANPYAVPYPMSYDQQQQQQQFFAPAAAAATMTTTEAHAADASCDAPGALFSTPLWAPSTPSSTASEFAAA